jgi:hypothetical protein
MLASLHSAFPLHAPALQLAALLVVAACSELLAFLLCNQCSCINALVHCTSKHVQNLPHGCCCCCCCCSALCNESTLSYQPGSSSSSYQRIGESTELALRVFVEKASPHGQRAAPHLRAPRQSIRLQCHLDCAWITLLHMHSLRAAGTSHCHVGNTLNICTDL